MHMGVLKLKKSHLKKEENENKTKKNSESKVACDGRIISLLCTSHALCSHRISELHEKSQVVYMQGDEECSHVCIRYVSLWREWFLSSLLWSAIGYRNLRVSSRYHLSFIRKLIRGLTDLVWNRN